MQRMSIQVFDIVQWWLYDALYKTNTTPVCSSTHCSVETWIRAGRPSSSNRESTHIRIPLSEDVWKRTNSPALPHLYMYFPENVLMIGRTYWSRWRLCLLQTILYPHQHCKYRPNQWHFLNMAEFGLKSWNWSVNWPPWFSSVLNSYLREVVCSNTIPCL